jgi:hypothetical protein
MSPVTNAKFPSDTTFLHRGASNDPPVPDSSSKHGYFSVFSNQVTKTRVFVLVSRPDE